MSFSRTSPCPFNVASLLGVATFALLGLAPAPGQAQTTISTVQQSTGQKIISSWGVVNTSTYGQTFTAPTDNVLNDVSFYLGGQFKGSGPINYQAYVYAWDGQKATGSALFTSAMQSYTPTGSDYASNLVYTSTGNTILTAGQKYVAFLTTAGLQTGRPQSTCSWGMTDSYLGAYSGGEVVFFNTGNDFNQLTTQSWIYVDSAWDTKFQMDFSPPSAAPEPPQFAVLGFTALGALGLILCARKRKAICPA